MQPQVSKYEKVLKREKKASAYMIQVYCESHHIGNGELCPECVQLKEFLVSSLRNVRTKRRKAVVVDVTCVVTRPKGEKK